MITISGGGSMATIKLDGISSTRNNSYGDLLIGIFYSSKRKHGQIWRARTLKSALRKGRTKKSPKGDFDRFVDDYRDFSGETLGDFSEYSGNALTFWVGGNATKNTKKVAQITPEVNIRETHFLVPQIFARSIDKNFKIIDLPRLILIQDAQKLAGQIQEKYPERTLSKWVNEHLGSPTEIFCDDFLNGIPFRNERVFFEKIGIGFQIFSRDQTNFGSKRRSDITIHHHSIFPDYLNLEYNGDWPNRSKILSTDKFRLHSKNQSNFMCPNDFCEFQTNRKKKFDKHVKSCTNETETVFRQDKMTEKNQTRQYLIENKYLDSDFHNTNFMTYDIESLASKENARVVSDNTSVLSEQKIVTVAFATKFNNIEKEYLFKRKSLSREDYQTFYSEIVNFLREIGEEYSRSLPSQIQESISILETKVAEFREKLKQKDPNDVMEANELSLKLGIPPPKERGLMMSGLRYLRRIQNLRIFGFNSEKYDLPILLPGLLSVLKLKKSEVECIKRGSGLMSVNLNIDGQVFSWLDSRNYLAGGSLAQFGTLFGGETTKGTFPYEYFQNIQEAKNCLAWPEFKFFNSSLKYARHDAIDRFHYAFQIARLKMQMKAGEFLRIMSIPDECYHLDSDDELPEIDFEKAGFDKIKFDPVEYIEGLDLYNDLYELGIVTDLFSYLGYYNRNDVKILRSALSNYVTLFIENLGVNPLDFISLPGLAESIMWSKFSEKVGSPFSFEKREIADLVRLKRHGGITIILGVRHVEVNVPPSERTYHKSVYTTPNGSTIMILISFDFNNLYGHAMRMLMPVGPGIEYEKKGDKFRWESLMNPNKHKFSLEAIEWLNFMESHISSDGSRVVIHHKMNTGEKSFVDTFIDPETQETKTRTFKPDGYAFINGIHNYFEYDGCHFHKCELNCSTSRKSRRNKTRDDTARDAFYRKTGILHKISSCTWLKQRKKLKFPIHTSVFFHRRHMMITGAMILTKVRSGKFFGLIRVDLKSPPPVIQKFLKLNFPPIFQHMEIESHMIHPHYQNMIGGENRERKVLSQTFHAKQILLTTETARFYSEIGIEISNLTWAVEFEKDKPFAEFVQQKTDERKKATREGNKPLQNIWKLVMNRLVLIF